MGMTLWLQTLDGRTMSDDSDDYSLMYDMAEKLDDVCEELDLPKLTSFFDTTDIEMSGMDDYDDDEDQELDDETGLPYGIDDMQWFDAGTGLNMLQALRDYAEQSWEDLDEDSREILLEELDGCIDILTDLPEGGQFHLAVIN